MWNSFNEVSSLEEEKEYVCVVDNEGKHIFKDMQDANNFVAYQAENNEEIFTSYSYGIFNIKCTEIIKKKENPYAMLKK